VSFLRDGARSGPTFADVWKTALQWLWPIPLLVACYFAPESPWNAVRRNKLDLAKKSLHRLRSDSPNKNEEVEATLAYIRHTTELEKAETEGASFFECFKGTNLRRTEIVSSHSTLLPFEANEPYRTVLRGKLS
jgi:hypothetical protein